MMANNANKIYLTREGFDKIKREYRELVEVKRPETVTRLAEARREGDLSENNEYVQSRQQLSFIDGRIAELKAVIDRAVVVEKDHAHCQKIGLGCRVTVRPDGGQQQVFHLVGEWEADPAVQKISFESPLGRSLLGKRVGDEVVVEVPAGRLVYKVVKID